MKYTEELILKALESRKQAYAPYSGFRVGVALLTVSGEIYGGFNAECASYPVGSCAERMAFMRALFDGHRSFKSIAVVGGNEKETGALTSYCPPCGMCRQLMREFCEPENFEIILAKSVQDFKIFTLEKILPLSFGPNHL